MKLFIISDIHGSLTSFSKAISQFEKEKSDYLVICGDYLNHGPRNNIPEGYDTKKLAEDLNRFKEKIIGVRGNCDSEVDQMLLHFPIMSESANILLPSNKRVFVNHGHLYSEEDYQKILSENTIIISGHTHIPVLEKKLNMIFVNPGSISIPKNNSESGYALIESDFSFTNIKLCNLEGIVLKSLNI